MGQGTNQVSHKYNYNWWIIANISIRKQYFFAIIVITCLLCLTMISLDKSTYPKIWHPLRTSPFTGWRISRFVELKWQIEEPRATILLWCTGANVKNKQTLIDLYSIHTENKMSTNSINYSYSSYLQMSDKGCLSQNMIVRSSMLLPNLGNV